MQISYAIPVCNEHIELEKLLSFLLKHIDENDEIVVQCDKGNTTDKVYQVLQHPRFKVIEFPLNGHFSNFKNNLKENCSGDWIFQIDADEYPDEYLIINNSMDKPYSNHITKLPPLEKRFDGSHLELNKLPKLELNKQQFPKLKKLEA